MALKHDLQTDQTHMSYQSTVDYISHVLRKKTHDIDIGNPPANMAC